MSIVKRLFGRRPDSTEAESPPISPTLPALLSAFETLFGRPPEEKDREKLAFLDLDPEYQRLHPFRTVTAAFDQQVYQTPFVVRFTEKDLGWVELPDFGLVIDYADISVGRPILHDGHYEPHLTRFFREHLRPGMTVVDVGGNIGYYSILSATLIGESGKVLTFEPSSENCRLIQLSALRNKIDNIRLHPVALSNTSGSAFFSHHLGTNAGLRPSETETLLAPNCTVVPIFRMEQVIDEPVHFMKVDTEGAEGLVVEGAKSLIEKYRPIYTCEFSMEMLPRVSGQSGKDYLSYFRSIDYDLYLLEKTEGEMVPISDIDAFLGEWGDLARIEDLAFMPR